MAQALEIQLPLSTATLEAYIQSAGCIPVLSAEDEQRLAALYREQGDLNAARQLVMSHLRFVVHIARGYNGYGLPQADLIQEGNIGLMKAVKRFDPTVGVRLVSYAVHWIRAEMHEFILRNWRIVKVATTKAQRKLFFNLRSAKKRLGWMNQDEVNVVAHDLGVDPKTVREMEARLSAHDAAFDQGTDEDNGHDVVAPAGYLQDLRFEPASQLEQLDWQQHNAGRLHEALATLDARSQVVIQERWLGEDKTTLQELADRYQISAERIRQIEQTAMKKLKAALAA